MGALCLSEVVSEMSIPTESGGDIATREIRIAEEMIRLIKAVSDKRYPDAPIKRFNQVKSLGCFDVDFTVLEDLPEHLRHGLFAQPGTHRAYIRFANASSEDDSKKDLRGMSIKIFDVQGTPLWGKPGEQDFLLNSYPALFAGTPEDFLKFIQAVHAGRIWSYFINPLDSHLASLRLLMKARQQPASPFDIQYWSTTPFRLGGGASTVVKYSVQPSSDYQSSKPSSLTKNYLSDAMQTHLQQGPACFDFMLQLQTDPESMPIEDASVIWDEGASPFIKVASITINDQNFRANECMDRCEQISFNPWQSLPEHMPLGGINRVRHRVYSEIAAYRAQ